MSRSGDMQNKLTAETRSRGEETAGHLTTEARRHGEEHKEVLEIDFSDHPINRGPRRARFWLGGVEVTCDHRITRSLCICLPERVGAHATASRRTPAMSVPKHAVSGSSHETLKDLLLRLASAMQTLLAAIREIFDESPYERFLLRTHAGRSIASYRAFTRERDAAMQRKPRCC